MTNIKQYSFFHITECNMCGADIGNLKPFGRRLDKQQGFSPNRKVGISISVCKCLKCGLVFSNPLPRPANIQDHYGVPPESYWGESYFLTSPDYFKTEIEWFKSLVRFEPGMKSLDIGAGIGKQMIVLSRSGFDAYGLEPGEGFYERAISNMKIPKEKISLSTLENAEYDSEFFDFISFGAVLEHLYDPSYCIKKAITWLKKDGLIHIEVPSSSWLISKLINTLYRLKGLDYVTNISPMHNPYHLYEFTPKSFILNGLNSEYKLADHKYYVCKTFMPKWMDPGLKKYMKLTNTGMQLCVWLKKSTV